MIPELGTWKSKLTFTRAAISTAKHVLLELYWCFILQLRITNNIITRTYVIRSFKFHFYLITEISWLTAAILECTTALWIGPVIRSLHIIGLMDFSWTETSTVIICCIFLWWHSLFWCLFLFSVNIATQGFSWLVFAQYKLSPFYFWSVWVIYWVVTLKVDL